MRPGLALLLPVVLAIAAGGCHGAFPNPYASAFVAPAEPQPPPEPQAQAEPQAQPTEPQAPAQPEPQQPAPVTTTTTTSDVTITHTVTRAPTYPSSPFVATWPTSRGGSDHVCKAFTRSTDNKNDCMAHCRAELMAVGSCSCLELERCPEGVRTVD
ncbi:MAG TPA: hypothetical protein VFU21_05555 [Kofleriaceae bacterium]|nr:hypothetical protein [Kofleriaceae bacterium]